MKKILITLFVLIFFFSVVFASRVSAKIITNEKGNVTVAKTEVVDDDLFIGAQTAVIEGTVNGDVFVGAQTVKITGTINGNLHAGANTLDLNGNINGNVYAGAQNISVSNCTIAGSLLVGGATINVYKDTSIGGSVIAGAGTLSIDSQIKRSVYAGTGNFILGDNATIGKDLYYASGKDDKKTNISSHAQIGGSTYKKEFKTSQRTVKTGEIKKKAPGILSAFNFAAAVFSFLGALVVGLLCLKLFGKHFSKTESLISQSFWKTFGVGFLVTVSLIPGLIMLCITVVGIPLAGIVFAVFLLYSYLAKIVVGMVFGRWISRRMKWKIPSYGMFVLGLFAIYLLKMIPVVGFLAGFVVLWIGLGALTLQIFDRKLN